MLLAWAGGRWLRIEPLERLSLSLADFTLGLVATVPMLLGLAWTVRTRWPPARGLVDLVVRQLGPVLAGSSPFQLALLACLAGVGEELLFRGVVQVGLERMLPALMAVIAAGVIFGLVHFASPTYALLAALVGVYLGALFLLLENLLIPIVAHSVYDFIALTHVVQRYRGVVDSAHGRNHRNQ